MKSSNLSKELVVSYLTFDHMIFALMLLIQLFNAAYDIYAAGTVMTQLGSRRSLTFLHRFIWMAILSCIVSVLKKQMRLPTSKELPHLLLAGVLHLFLGYTLFAKTTYIFDLHIVILWQPIFPVIIMSCAIFLRMDKWTPFKIAGAVVSIVGCIGLIISINIFGEEFHLNFFILPHIIAAAVGAINLSLSLKGGMPIFTFCFWMAIVGAICCFAYYSLQYSLHPTPPFFSYTYQLGLLNMGMTFSIRVILDTVGESIFIYIVSKNQIVLASVYSSLFSIFVIIIYILQRHYSWFLFPYMFMVYLGFTLITYDKKRISKIEISKTVSFRYYAKLDCDQDARLSNNFALDTGLIEHKLLKTRKSISIHPNTGLSKTTCTVRSSLLLSKDKLDQMKPSMLNKSRRGQPKCQYRTSLN
ncbi:unnamed protein product [Moneuplotes crassus]|uniref:EamA domain-containing protein n=1 Tax=Euplotes crassus TaxID=5936 RepID=A0AAD1X973_EUPCR|nr:unnamed protein product [Moneuplotes crassus]